ncbi:AAA family ATPase, partial [Patescibacteria group bacterium]|nr:AAA family ATPase [Patescibacteria group bacterium]
MLTNDITSNPANTDQRQAALNSEARVRLIEGAPGVGKTYFGCQLAQYEFQAHRAIKQSYQSVLFLTFARNAVARIRQAYLEQTCILQPGTIRRAVSTESPVASRVRIDTFAAFFWWLVDSYGRFAPGGSRLRPWFIGSRKTGADFVPEGHTGYTFDELKECARSILRVEAVQLLVSDVYPLVIVDEHQDIDLTLHKITVLLAKGSNLVLLRGPGQCIYRGLHKFNPDEVQRRTDVDLQPQRFRISSLGMGQQRHCGEIGAFLSQYDNNGTCTYDNVRVQRQLKHLQTKNGIPNPLETHIAIAVRDIGDLLKKISPHKNLFSVAVLASTNRAVAQIHKRITDGSSTYNLRPRRATPLFDDSLLLYYGRLVLQLLDDHWIALERRPIDESLVAVALASFSKTADDVSKSSYQDYLPVARQLSCLVSGMTRPASKADPAAKIDRDLDKINNYLHATKNKRPMGTPQMPFTKTDSSLLTFLGDRFVASIKPLIKSSGIMNIKKAKVVFEKALQQRIILEKLGVQRGVEVMTIHKSKGREFDAVVLALENDHTALWRNTNRLADEEIDDLYRVAISRARDALIVVAFSDALTLTKS